MMPMGGTAQSLPTRYSFGLSDMEVQHSSFSEPGNSPCRTFPGSLTDHLVEERKPEAAEGQELALHMLQRASSTSDRRKEINRESARRTRKKRTEEITALRSKMAEQESTIEGLRKNIDALQGEVCNLSKDNAKLLQQMMQVNQDFFVTNTRLQQALQMQSASPSQSTPPPLMLSHSYSEGALDFGTPAPKGMLSDFYPVPNSEATPPMGPPRSLLDNSPFPPITPDSPAASFAAYGGTLGRSGWPSQC